MSDPLARLFLERAKGCTLNLDVCLFPPFPGRIMVSSSPRDFTTPTLCAGQRIRALTVKEVAWSEIEKLFGGWADAVSSLHELEPHLGQSLHSSHIFLGEALRNLTLTGCAVPGLSYIKAPKLTVLEIREVTLFGCSVGNLFDFFEASPTLEYISIDVNFLRGPPPDRRVTLPCLRRIFLGAADPFGFASHLICPSKADTHFVIALSGIPTASIFPPNLPRLLGQHSVEIIDRVFMRVVDDNKYKNCSLQFGTLSGTTLRVF